MKYSKTDTYQLMYILPNQVAEKTKEPVVTAKLIIYYSCPKKRKMENDNYAIIGVGDIYHSSYQYLCKLIEENNSGEIVLGSKDTNLFIATICKLLIKGCFIRFRPL